ncbi:uncharacterized protein HKW66_Vig0204030 [Vigna angularis]|uniref:Uncharacterized protein n=1 Tax=Phaseolus angularis TaxID=3914 RepID=A0A8T0JSS0_PHAAN|nr:uncharacterized protein HKW66_Vig0204030 [Vigna angularis]
MEEHQEKTIVTKFVKSKFFFPKVIRISATDQNATDSSSEEDDEERNLHRVKKVPWMEPLCLEETFKEEVFDGLNYEVDSLLFSDHALCEQPLPTTLSNVDVSLDEDLESCKWDVDSFFSDEAFE